jgi:hypothetical protein
MKIKPCLFLLLAVLLSGCDSKNTDTVADEEIKKDTLISMVASVSDTLPPAFDDTKFNNLAFNCFFQLGVKTGGKLYFSETRDSVYKVINEVLKNHAVQKSDIVFLIDNTGSMTDDIENVKKNLNEILDFLKTVKNVRVGVALYGDKNTDGTNWYRRTDLSTDLEKMRTFINAMYVNGGGDFPESTYDGLYRTVEEMNWESKSKRMILLIGDAPGLEPPLTVHNRKEVIDKCLEKKVKANVYPILIDTGAGTTGKIIGMIVSIFKFFSSEKKDSTSTE